MASAWFIKAAGCLGSQATLAEAVVTGPDQRAEACPVAADGVFEKVLPGRLG